MKTGAESVTESQSFAVDTEFGAGRWPPKTDAALGMELQLVTVEPALAGAESETE